MTESNSAASESFKKPISDSSAAASPAPVPAPNSNAVPQKAKSSWRDKLHLGSKTEEPGKESWRDASLSEEKRWKEWQKAKDREQREGGATGVFTQPYKAKGKGKWAYWLAL
ncbi:hypothetical protein CC86DRAFT_372340 [Ophiobolus disseminans]|uniref:Uncharacterized protein n=1 Tax=Ophiobolus disseminans TaxID=1469910 RepID=A0A6A6ZSR1_9PLEO|nr:hypothetical protein CC86DRAFT_372340 [Ophiobolus disseminans]